MQNKQNNWKYITSIKRLLVNSSHGMGSLVAKNHRSILVAIFPICIARSLEIKPMFCLHSSFCHCRRRSAQYVHFALHLWRPYTPTSLLVVQPDGIINTMFFDPCRLSVVRWVITPVIWWLNTRGDHRHNRRTDDRLVYSPYNGDVHLPGKRSLCSLCRRRRHASCCCCTHYA